MTSTNMTDFRQNLVAFLDQAALSRDVISVSTENGKVILLSEEEYRGLIETLRLRAIPGMEERILEGMRTPLEECDDFEW